MMVLALASIASTGIASIILANTSADTTDTDIICSDELSVSTLMERYQTCASIQFHLCIAVYSIYIHISLP